MELGQVARREHVEDHVGGAVADGEPRPRVGHEAVDVPPAAHRDRDGRRGEVGGETDRAGGPVEHGTEVVPRPAARVEEAGSGVGGGAGGAPDDRGDRLDERVDQQRVVAAFEEPVACRQHLGRVAGDPGARCEERRVPALVGIDGVAAVAADHERRYGVEVVAAGRAAEPRREPDEIHGCSSCGGGRCSDPRAREPVRRTAGPALGRARASARAEVAPSGGRCARRPSW